QRKSQHTASAFRRREILAQGLMWLSYVTRTNAQARSAVRTKNHRRKAAAILLWREVLEAFHHVRKAHKSIITGRLTLAFSLWRKSGRIFKREHSRS
ncbi:unnamed protein product, partial [Sphacelaria rigidula]